MEFSFKKKSVKTPRVNTTPKKSYPKIKVTVVYVDEPVIITDDEGNTTETSKTILKVKDELGNIYNVDPRILDIRGRDTVYFTDKGKSVKLITDKHHFISYHMLCNGPYQRYKNNDVITGFINDFGVFTV